MRKSRFSDEQIIGILREQESGRPTAGVCRKHGVSGATLYKWKSKFGGLDVSDAKRLKALEGERASGGRVTHLGSIARRCATGVCGRMTGPFDCAFESLRSCGGASATGVCIF